MTKRRWAELLEQQRRLFITTRNPVWLWLAYRTCRAAKLKVADWILEQFDEMSARMASVSAMHPVAKSRKQSREWQDEALIALGFPLNGKGGPNDPFVDRQDTLAQLTLASEMRVLIDGDGFSQMKARFLVAHKFSVDEGRPRRAWERFKDVVRAQDITTQRADAAWLDQAKRELGALSLPQLTTRGGRPPRI